HALLAGTFFYIFCRRLAVSPPAAVVGALVFAYAGPVLQNLGSPHMTVAVWWPALLTTVDGVIRAPSLPVRVRWLAAGATVSALMHLSGNPQIAAYGFLLAGAFALYRSWPLPLLRRTAALGWCAALVLLGTGLAAPQLLSSL